MRQAVDDWMNDIDDQGLINEAEMVQRMWPGGEQPRTATPFILPRRTTEVAQEDTYRLEGPAEVVVYTPTQGASVAYTTESGDGARWRQWE